MKSGRDRRLKCGPAKLAPALIASRPLISGPPGPVLARALAEPDRGPHEVLAFDGEGELVGRQLVDETADYGPRIHWEDYGPPAPRVPSQCQPGVA